MANEALQGWRIRTTEHLISKFETFGLWKCIPVLEKAEYPDLRILMRMTEKLRSEEKKSKDQYIAEVEIALASFLVHLKSIFGLAKEDNTRIGDYRSFVSNLHEITLIAYKLNKQVLEFVLELIEFVSMSGVPKMIFPSYVSVYMTMWHILFYEKDVVMEALAKIANISSEKVIAREDDRFLGRLIHYCLKKGDKEGTPHAPSLYAFKMSKLFVEYWDAHLFIFKNFISDLPLLQSAIQGDINKREWGPTIEQYSLLLCSFMKKKAVHFKGENKFNESHLLFAIPALISLGFTAKDFDQMVTKANTFDELLKSVFDPLEQAPLKKDSSQNSASIDHPAKRYKRTVSKNLDDINVPASLHVQENSSGILHSYPYKKRTDHAMHEEEITVSALKLAVEQTSRYGNVFVLTDKSADMVDEITKKIDKKGHELRHVSEKAEEERNVVYFGTMADLQEFYEEQEGMESLGILSDAARPIGPQMDDFLTVSPSSLLIWIHAAVIRKEMEGKVDKNQNTLPIREIFINEVVASVWNEMKEIAKGKNRLINGDFVKLAVTAFFDSNGRRKSQLSSGNRENFFMNTFETIRHIVDEMERSESWREKTREELDEYEMISRMEKTFDTYFPVSGTLHQNSQQTELIPFFVDKKCWLDTIVKEIVRNVKKDRAVIVTIRSHYLNLIEGRIQPLLQVNSFKIEFFCNPESISLASKDKRRVVLVDFSTRTLLDLQNAPHVHVIATCFPTNNIERQRLTGNSLLLNVESTLRFVLNTSHLPLEGAVSFRDTFWSLDEIGNDEREKEDGYDDYEGKTFHSRVMDCMKWRDRVKVHSSLQFLELALDVKEGLLPSESKMDVFYSKVKESPEWRKFQKHLETDLFLMSRPDYGSSQFAKDLCLVGPKASWKHFACVEKVGCVLDTAYLAKEERLFGTDLEETVIHYEGRPTEHGSTTFKNHFAFQLKFQDGEYQEISLYRQDFSFDEDLVHLDDKINKIAEAKKAVIYRKLKSEERIVDVIKERMANDAHLKKIGSQFIREKEGIHYNIYLNIIVGLFFVFLSIVMFFFFC